MHSVEGPERLWPPILSLGPSARCWVSDLLGAWLIHDPKAAVSPIAFTKRWREMIRNALDSPAWNALGDRSAFRRADLMIELMGLSWQGGSIGESDYTIAIESLKPEFSKFAERLHPAVRGSPGPRRRPVGHVSLRLLLLNANFASRFLSARPSQICGAWLACPSCGLPPT